MRVRAPMAAQNGVSRTPSASALSGPWIPSRRESDNPIPAAALTSPSALARDATALAIELQERIAAEPAFEQVVAVPEGESVVLTGAVATEEEKALLDELISSVEDADDVDNQVSVR